MTRPAVRFTLRATVAAIALSGCTHFSVNEPVPQTAANPPATPPSAAPAVPTVPVAAAAPAKGSAPGREECGPGHMSTGEQRYFQVQDKKVAETRVNATGYGAPPKTYFPEPQRRLMAMRAATVDAYRNLAERVNGLRVWGGTTIGDMVVENDRFRVYLDAYVRGAEIISTNPLEDGTFETVVELTVNQDFLEKAVGDATSATAYDPCADAPRFMQSQTPAAPRMSAPTPAAPAGAFGAALPTPPSATFYYADDSN